jgi:signal transduction histidine kinase
MKRLDGRIFPTSTDSSASEPTRRIPLLYVEDNETNFDIAQNILMSHFEVTWARSPNEARAHLSKSRPAVILLDIEFSGEEESGLDFLAALRNGEVTGNHKVHELPVVILTAYSSAYDPHELKGYGADDAIFKPIEPTQLTSICHALAQRTIQLEDNSQSYDQLQREMKELKDKLVSSQIAYETTNKVLARATERLAEQYQSRTKLIEERNLLQREIDEATRQLIRADRLATLGSLVSGVAHDITNPTNLIAMNKEVLHTHIRELESVITELLGDASGEEAEILNQMFQKVFGNCQQALSDITLGVDRIYSINQAIRKQSRNDEEKTEFLVHELLRECITIVRARSKAVELTLVGDEDLEFTGYRSHLGQVFMNLLSNGIDAAEEKAEREGTSPRVELSFELNATELRFSVKDNGYGIPIELRDKIFAPFFTTKPSGKGTGLGMPIVLKIIEEHDGRIELGPVDKSRGAHFDIYFPI